MTNEIKNDNKSFKKFEKSKLYLDKDIYNAGRHKVQKKICFFTESIGKPSKSMEDFIIPKLPNKMVKLTFW